MHQYESHWSVLKAHLDRRGVKSAKAEPQCQECRSHAKIHSLTGARLQNYRKSAEHEKVQCFFPFHAISVTLTYLLKALDSILTSHHFFLFWQAHFKRNTIVLVKEASIKVMQNILEAQPFIFPTLPNRKLLEDSYIWSLLVTALFVRQLRILRTLLAAGTVWTPCTSNRN